MSHAARRATARVRLGMTALGVVARVGVAALGVVARVGVAALGVVARVGVAALGVVARVGVAALGVVVSGLRRLLSTGCLGLRLGGMRRMFLCRGPVEGCASMCMMLFRWRPRCRPVWCWWGTMKGLASWRTRWGVIRRKLGF
ncbi:hypothetical protein ACFY36_37065 [Actinoplanes sp. NPDC000266]